MTTDKIQRATEIHRAMTPHQMALRIVELEDIAEIVGQSASDRSKRITELQDALELAEEAVRAKHFPDAAKMVPDWCVIVGRAEISVVINALNRDAEDGKPVRKEMADELIHSMERAMLASAPKLGGE